MEERMHMRTLIGVGLGKDDNHYKAGKMAINSACDQIGKKPNLIMVFSSFNLDAHKVLEGILESMKDVPLIGCTSPKEIGPVTSQEDTVVVVAISSDLEIRVGTGKNFKQHAREAGKELAHNLMAGLKENPKGNLIILPDGVGGNGTEMVKGIYSIFGPDVSIIGGAAGDNYTFLKTYQFINGDIITDSIPGALILSESSIMGIGIKHGFFPSGVPMVVTMSEGNKIYELDGEPAFDIYLSYFGLRGKIKPENFRELTQTHTHPLGSPQMRGEYLIRHFVNANEDGSITCSAELLPNTIVRIMDSTKESLISAVSEAAKQAKDGLNGTKPKGVLIFNCISRIWILENEYNREIDEIKKVFGTDVPICGFYTYGEIGATEGGQPLYHNKTIVIAAIG